MPRLRDYTWYNLAERYYYPYYRGTYLSRITRTDAEIREAVEIMLAGDPWLDDAKITVAVKDGQVTLRGTVDTFFEKRVAGDHAADVKGVKNVNNNLELRVL